MYPTNSAVAKVGSRWIGMPWATVGLLIAYRKSWFADVGYSTFPDTWEKYLDAGRKLAEGSVTDIVNDPAVIEAYLGSRHAGG